MPPASTTWKSTKTTEGKTYYFNTITSVTQWTKPEELMTAEERATVGTDWQVLDHNGKQYWAHKETKQTTWEPPAEVKQNMERLTKPPPPAPA
jgi:pre-mRNA-processing factor 40